MRRLDGVGEVRVELETGLGVVLPVEGGSFDPTEIAEAVRKAGFDPGEIQLVALGKLRQEDGLVLELGGPLPKLALVGGEQIGELTKSPQLLGQDVRITGKLHGSHGDQIPGLTVESWERLEETGLPPPEGCGATPSPPIDGGVKPIAGQHRARVVLDSWQSWLAHRPHPCRRPPKS